MNTLETPTLEPQDLLALEEAAEFLCVSKSTMYRLLDQGKLQGMKAGKQWRFRKADLLAYMQRDPAALALGNLPMKVLDAELDFFAEELARAGASTADCDDPTLEGEAGKIAQLVRRMIWLLCVRKGSDLHLEPIFSAGTYCTLLRLRIDGVLQEVRRLPAVLHQSLMLHWKQQAGFNRDEHARPQEGSARLMFKATMQLPLRVSIVPTIYGEKAAIRTIPTRVPSMVDLGIAETPLPQWVQKHHGLILVVGPTGSGKATTTVACLRERISPGVNVMTVEETIEYLLLPGATQVHLEGISHAEGLRALFKQDPDIVYAGDISDNAEVAQLTVWMAETGHLTFATMHAHDSIQPLYHIVECGVKRSMLANNLIGCVAQNLLPKLCPACKTPAEIPPEYLQQIIAAAAAGNNPVPADTIFYHAPGCEQCHQTGHAGRLAVQEYFTFSPESKAAFINGATPEELGKLALAQGMKSFIANAVQFAVQGLTSLEVAERFLPR